MIHKELTTNEIRTRRNFSTTAQATSTQVNLSLGQVPEQVYPLNVKAAGGIDLIIIYNSGRFRMAGRGSLAGMMPYGDANQIVIEMASEVLPVVPDTPVLAGVCGTDPFRLMDVLLKTGRRCWLLRGSELPNGRSD